ncbi:MAG: type II toxin-antitoxin system VapC family toxin [Byssovorax sp.]
MSSICLDTSAYSYFKRGDTAAVSVVRRARTIYVPTVVLGELRTGFLLGNRGDVNERELREFLDHPAVTIADVDSATASIYASLMVALRRNGTPVPTNDVWIGAVAMRHGAAVLTFDAHFTLIPGVEARVLPKEPGRER